jgi:hypothetical protein
MSPEDEKNSAKNSTLFGLKFACYAGDGFAVGVYPKL